jgi:hypothetical protein
MRNKSLGLRFFIAWIVLAVIWHEGITNLNVRIIDYSSLEPIFRPFEDEARLWWVEMLADILLPGSFVWLYARGVDHRPWFWQGALFGLVAGILGVIPMFMRYSVVLPQAPIVLREQLVYFTVLMVMMGISVAWIYRNAMRSSDP